MSDDIDPARRDILLQLLSTGVLANGMLLPQLVQGMGKVPKVIPPGKSFFEIKGDVKVNKQPASLDSIVTTKDIVSTGSNSHAVFVVGKDAFILRSNSAMEIEGSAVINSLRLFSGKVLSVFGHRTSREKLHMRSSTATIGIRGTGVYMEADPEKTYLCTCYGVTDLYSNVDKNARIRVKAQHHDAPKYILAKASQQGKLIVPGPMINHTDMELALVEELVGREVPFGIEGDLYKGPRRGY